MKSILTTTLLLFFISIIQAQNPSKLDSLKNVLAHLPAEGKSFSGDTLRVRVLCEMGEKGVFFMGDSILVILEDAQRIADKRGWEKGVAMTQNVWGNFHAAKNEYMLAIDFLFKSLSTSIELNDKSLIAKNYVGLSDCYSLLGNHKKAIEYNMKSLIMYKNLENFEAYIRGINNLGMLYHDHKDYKNAIIIFKKGLMLNKKYNFHKLNILFLANLGLSLTQNKQYDEAIACNEQVLKNQERGLESIKIVIFISLAEIFLHKNQLQKSLSYLQKAETLMKTGKEIDDAMLFFSEISYKTYRKLNQPEKALTNYITYNEIKQRHTSQDAEKRVQGLQFEFDNKNQQKEIQVLKRNGFIALGVVSILILFGLILFNINKKLAVKNTTIETQKEVIIRANHKLELFNGELEQQVELRTEQLQKANADLVKKNDEIMAALVEGQQIERKRVSVELHDSLGSTISGIKYRLQALDLVSFSPKEKDIYTSIMQMMNDAYAEVRLISHHLLPAEFEKKGLRVALEKLVQDLNFSHKFRLNLIFKSPKNPLSKKIEIELYSICLELVNNIIKHADSTEAEILLFTNTNYVVLNIQDNGKCLVKLKEGFGLKNIQARISKLDGEIDIQQRETGTDIIVKIPFKEVFYTSLDYIHTT